MSVNLRRIAGELNEVGVGETRRVNHEDCPAGEDTRRRLYLTRPHSDPTKVLAYCHNCQDSGLSINSQYEPYRDQRHSNPAGVPITKVKEIVVPHQLIHKIQDWPVTAQAWAYSNGILDRLADSYGIAYDPSTDRVYLPRYQKWHYSDSGGRGEQLIGYQLRDVTGHGSKYLTVQRQDEEPYSVLTPQMPLVPPHKKGSSAVIVEDLLSAIHIAEAHCITGSLLPDVYVNYGVKIQNHMLWHLKDNRHIQVWLDNDSPHVEKQAQDIARTAQLFAPDAKTSVVRDKRDPKHLHGHYQELVMTMDDAWTT